MNPARLTPLPPTSPLRAGFLSPIERAHMNEHFRQWLDATAAGIAAATMAGILPSIASLLSIVWLTIQIYEWAKKKRGGNDL